MDPAAAVRTAAWYATPPGQRAAALLQAAVLPWLSPNAATRVLAFDSGPLLAGTTIAPLAHVVGAPVGGDSASPPVALIAEPQRLPFVEAVFDTVLAVHTLEHGPAPALLREIWRILAPAGDLVVVVPNRIGPWPWRRDSPSGDGRGYSRRALTRLLDSAMFEVVEWKKVAAPRPPVGRGRIEKIIARLLPWLGGVHVVRAGKRDGLAPVGPVVAQPALRRTKIA